MSWVFTEKVRSVFFQEISISLTPVWKSVISFVVYKWRVPCYNNLLIETLLPSVMYFDKFQSCIPKEFTPSHILYVLVGVHKVSPWSWVLYVCSWSTYKDTLQQGWCAALSQVERILPLLLWWGFWYFTSVVCQSTSLIIVLSWLGHAFK
jgi:hypothetical protein